MSTIIYHNHHIIPKYRCKEIGIDPDFEGNLIRLTRLEHGQAHYERWLKHKDPRDLGAAQVLASGEIDGIDMSGKNHPMWGKHHTLESRKKMSVSGKKRSLFTPNPMLGKTHTPEARKKISEARKGKKLSPEHIENIVTAQTGSKHTLETRKKMSIAQKGRIITEEHRAKLRAAQTGRKLSEETKKKMSVSAKNKPPVTDETKKNMSEAWWKKKKAGSRMGCIK